MSYFRSGIFVIIFSPIYIAGCKSTQLPFDAEHANTLNTPKRTVQVINIWEPTRTAFDDSHTLDHEYVDWAPQQERFTPTDRSAFIENGELFVDWRS